jgi:AGZA family xanthine/uracil permease-like MFS transporter
VAPDTAAPGGPSRGVRGGPATARRRDHHAEREIVLEDLFQLRERGTDARREIAAGTTTFLTMAYIIVVQPAVLSGRMFGLETGLDFGAVTTATCLAAALSTALMALYARTPIAQAPGMGENFFFVLTVIPAAAAAGYANAWQVALGVVFLAGVLFLLITLLGLGTLLTDAISPSLRAGIAGGIGLFIAFIGLQNAGLVLKDPGTTVRLNPDWLSPDLIVFFSGLFTAGALHARRVRGAILWGIGVATLTAVVLKTATAGAVGAEMERFAIADAIVAAPPSLSPTFLKMDLAAALSLAMLPYVLVLLLMDFFDTLGTLVGVTEAAGLVEKGAFPHPQRAYLSDAVGTVAGAAMGTSTVTSFIESAAGVEQGARTGLAGLTTAALFVLALFFAPVVAMVGSYPPLTAPALVLVGAMMLRSVLRIDWSDTTEALPAFLILIGIPLSYSISDGLALGFVTYAILKIGSGRARELRWPMAATALVLLLYLVILRGGS